MESRVKTLNSDIGDYEETHQNDTQNMDSMMESIRSILIARTGSSAVSVTNYQAGLLQCCRHIKGCRWAMKQVEIL